MLIISIFPKSLLEENMKNVGLGNLEIEMVILMTKIIVVFVASIVIGNYFNLNYNKLVERYIRK